MKLSPSLMTAHLLAVLIGFTAIPTAHALDLDWGGDFRVENHFIKDYAGGAATTDSSLYPSQAGGYTVPGGGEKNASFTTLFLTLQPTVIVNDNVYIKSEWWVGDPVFGFFGDGYPFSFDQRQYYSNQSRGSFVRAQRYWAEVVTDVGTVIAGRAPLDWGLGLVWDAGDGVYDRYHTTGDQIRLISRLGLFSASLAYIKHSIGNNVSGACPDLSTAGLTDSRCNAAVGEGGVTDYSISVKYDNPDEDLELGVNFIKRLSGAEQGNSGILGVEGTTAGMNYNVWDLYGRKDFGDLSLGIEIPLTDGQIGGLNYSSVAAAGEVALQVSDSIDTALRVGYAPGQGNIGTGTDPEEFGAFYFNPGYKPALIMFNYQLANFVGPNTQNSTATSQTNLQSPFDNPITNALYASLNGGYRLGKWRFHTTWTWAQANEAAQPGTRFFNTWLREFRNFNPAAPAGQSKALGWEMDYGVALKWDDSLRFDVDFGWFFPGAYYAFSNAAQENNTASIFATTVRVGIAF